MNNIATRTTANKLEALFSAQVFVPTMLGMNTLALVALQQAGQIPDWIKTVAALFLAF